MKEMILILLEEPLELEEMSLDIFPASSSNKGIRVEFFGDEIDRIREFDVLTGEIIGVRKHVSIFPASHFATSKEKLEIAIAGLKKN